MHQDIALKLLLFLKDNNDLYKDVTIVPSNIPTSLGQLFENKNAWLANTDFAKESLEPEKSHLHEYKMVFNEASVISRPFHICLQLGNTDIKFNRIFICCQSNILINDCSIANRSVNVTVSTYYFYIQSWIKCKPAIRSI